MPQVDITRRRVQRRLTDAHADVRACCLAGTATTDDLTALVIAVNTYRLALGELHDLLLPQERTP